MYYIKRTWRLFDNYFLKRLKKEASTAFFWYLPEPPHLKEKEDLSSYQNPDAVPLFLIDYRQKLQYPLKNSEGIIVLPYEKPIGPQINPEAAFQYALGLHDQYLYSKDISFFNQFWHYVNYFLKKQTQDGLWEYEFDWFESKSPWASALAQTRGAAMMLRAWLHSKDSAYLTSAKLALKKFMTPIKEGGFLHQFPGTDLSYFEEYPKKPSSVMNGFMSSLICIWEMKYWVKEAWIEDLWNVGIHSLQHMLPHYSTGWWSLYDMDNTPYLNVNSPRYHLLEMNYLKVLSILSNYSFLKNEYMMRKNQYSNLYYRNKALVYKLRRKIAYR
jgi:hypothetical protein